MGDIKAFVSALLSSDLGEIVACNILGGLAARLYDSAFVAAVITWWEALVSSQGYRSSSRPENNELVAALCELPALHASRYPAGFVPPTIPMSDPYIPSRVGRLCRAGAKLASVRSAQTVVASSIPNDIFTLAAKGVDFLAKKGTANYANTLSSSWSKTAPRNGFDVRLSSFLTNPRDSFPILWFTPAGNFLHFLDGWSLHKKADAARDALGLVHVGQTNVLAVVTFEAGLAETRAHRGRPTFVDARRNTRFRCLKSNEGLSPVWGKTVNLSDLTSRSGSRGHDERVCGRTPDLLPPTGKEHSVGVKFLGSPALPRNDLVGERDGEFSDLLRETTDPILAGRTIEEALLAIAR